MGNQWIEPQTATPRMLSFSQRWVKNTTKNATGPNAGCFQLTCEGKHVDELFESSFWIHHDTPKRSQHGERIPQKNALISFGYQKFPFGYI